MTVAIIDYGSGNLRSAAKAFERAAGEVGLAVDIRVTADAETVAGAERIILPGVGAFADCKAGLAALPDLQEALQDAVTRRGRPFLGICVGMQLLAEFGQEHGRHAGFGWIPGEVVPLDGSDRDLRIPHMGWNELIFRNRRHPVFAGLSDGAHAYFVHGYGFDCRQQDDIIATVDYGGTVTAAVGRDNLVGTQFHPEKGQAAGLRLIGNFLEWRP